MKTRDVLGKRIVAVRQHRRMRDDVRDFAGMEVDAIILDDGTEIRPHAFETGYDVAADCIVVRKT